MNRVLPAALFCLAASSLVSAQLVSHPDAPVRVGHYHLNVTSIESHKKFWVDTLGGTAMKFGKIRSEERRVGKECRSRWSARDSKKNRTKRDVCQRIISIAVHE